MRRALLCSALLALPSVASAAPKWGGGGFLSQGFAVGNLAGNADDFGADATSLGLVLGGGGFPLQGGRVVLIGHGYGISGLGGVGDAATTEVSAGGGSGSIGWALVNEGGFLLAPHAGVAGHGTSVSVANGNDPAIVGGVDLLPGERETFSGGGLAVDLGFSMFQASWKNGGGLLVGASIGGWIPVTSQP